MNHWMVQRKEENSDKHGPRIGLPWKMHVLYSIHMLIFAVPENWFSVVGFDYLRWMPYLPDVLIRYVGDSAFPAATTLAFMTLPFVVIANVCLFGSHMAKNFHVYLQRRNSFGRELSPMKIFAAGSLIPLLYIWGGIYNRAQFALMPWFVPWENRFAAMFGLSAGYSLLFVVSVVGFAAEIKARKLD